MTSGPSRGRARRPGRTVRGLDRPHEEDLPMAHSSAERSAGLNVPAELVGVPIAPDIQRYALDSVSVPNGLYMEFGVFEGRSLRQLRRHLPPEVTLYGFDS